LVRPVFAEFDPQGWLELVVCGHPPPMRLNGDGELEPLAPREFATPLGMHPDLHASTYSVHAGDRLLFFTDGLLEARDRAGRFFRLEEHIPALRQPDLQSAADQLLDRIRAHTRHSLNDDIALLLVELAPAEPGEHPVNFRGRPRRASWPPADQPSRSQPKSRHHAQQKGSLRCTTAILSTARGTW
jgi:hypothetical protein